MYLFMDKLILEVGCLIRSVFDKLIILKKLSVNNKIIIIIEKIRINNVNL